MDVLLGRSNGERRTGSAVTPLAAYVHTNGAPADRPARADAEAAVRTLIRWAGDNPDRDGLRDTPARVARAYEEWFRGYQEDAGDLLQRTFDEIGSYQDPVLLRDIPVNSYCEHHMAPIHGKAHISYLPSSRVVGISKLVRVVEAFSRRLQIQERLTDDIANAIDRALNPLGVAVVLEADHACMSSRGVRSHGTRMVTKRMLGAFAEDGTVRREFLGAIGL
jgi:GTP cyclohydrolase I